MIRVILLGRTGNNLFQYALGRVLAQQHQVPLVLDGSWFNAQGWAEVSHFLRLPLQANVVRRLSLATRGLRKITGKHYWEYRGVPLLKESPDDQSFDRRFLNAPSDCVLFGYFQSPRYFADIADSLRAELNPLIAAAVTPPANLCAQLSQPQAVAVHVRRGDYLQSPLFKVCNRRYYQDAMWQMRERLPAPKFFIFSDDPAWCQAEFCDVDTQIIPPTSANPLQDLHLMSLASHQIIANSSYSWWAAWLGNKPGQQVILPDRWYAHTIKAPIEEKMLEHWTIAG